MLQEFAMFCYEHGGTLRNHKMFGKMYEALHKKIEVLDTARNLTPRAADAGL